jgi:hypothetical protein
MSAARSRFDDELRQQVTPLMREHGFKGSGRSFYVTPPPWA